METNEVVKLSLTGVPRVPGAPVGPAGPDSPCEEKGSIKHYFT